MLRLCFGLNRFSVDLDFWIIKKIDEDRLFRTMKECLLQSYEIRDGVVKYHTVLFEIGSKNYPSNLKMEIKTC